MELDRWTAIGILLIILVVLPMQWYNVFSRARQMKKLAEKYNLTYTKPALFGLLGIPRLFEEKGNVIEGILKGKKVLIYDLAGGNSRLPIYKTVVTIDNKEKDLSKSSLAPIEKIDFLLAELR